MRASIGTALLLTLTVAATLAMAGDDPQGPAKKAVEQWGGSYVGLNLGTGWGGSQTSSSPVFDENGNFSREDVAAIGLAGAQSFSDRGFAGGVQIGRNWQQNRFVYGLEVDVNPFSQRGSTSVTGNYPPRNEPAPDALGPTSFSVASSVTTDWMWTLRPRVGYATDRCLFFATAGLAISRVNANFTFFEPNGITGDAVTSATRTGLVLGGGVETALRKHWSLKAEYLYVDLGTLRSSSQLTGAPLPPFALPAAQFPTTGATVDHSASLHSNFARLGLNYRF